MGGERTGELGVCPAASDTSFYGINGGKNAGRICWAVAGTFCNDEIQGSFAEKRSSCVKCEFYQKVCEDQRGRDLKTELLQFIMMRHDFALEPEFLCNFRNEASAIASLRHENILRVYDIEERFRTVFIIMEYVEGESLRLIEKSR